MPSVILLRGQRTSAREPLLGIGKVDYGSIDEIFPKDKGIEVIGASSDHTILDIEDEESLKPGDIVSFGINYASSLSDQLQKRTDRFRVKRH